MGPGDLSSVIAVTAPSASAMTLLAFGFLRRRDAVAWESDQRGAGTEAQVSADPDIARRIASLIRPSDDAPDTDDPTDTTEEVLADGSDAWPAEDETDAGHTIFPGLSLDPLAVALPEPVWPALDRVADALASAPPEAAIDAEGAPWGAAVVDGLGTGGLTWPGVAPDREVLARLLIDPVTGLGTALAWDLWVGNEDPRVRRYRRPATVVLAELDGLDAVGAFHGPEVAEGAAAMIGAAFRANIRSSDHAAVVGPGLYAVLLTETDEIRAVNFVERVRATCEEWLAANSPGVRIIIGWASPDTDGLAGARRLAERRLARERR